MNALMAETATPGTTPGTAATATQWGVASDGTTTEVKANILPVSENIGNPMNGF
jgi:hypothetical protein